MVHSLSENVDDGIGGAGVETGRRLVQEQNRLRHNQLHADVRSLSLAARHTADKLSAHLYEDI